MYTCSLGLQGGAFQVLNFRPIRELRFDICLLQEAKKVRAEEKTPWKFRKSVSDNILQHDEGDLDAPVWQEGGLFDDAF